MAFLPQEFVSNINNKSGLARPCRYEVILPIPQYIAQYVGQSFFEKIQNLPNQLITDFTDFLRNGEKDPQSTSYNIDMSRYLALQCENAEIPGRSLQTTDVKVYGPTFKVPFQTQYNETNLTFLCTNDFFERKLFDRWLEAIMPSDTNNLRFPKGKNSRYMTNIKIVQYDDVVKQIYAVELMDAFPVSISAQQLSWQDEGFHRVTVQFAYQRYRVVYLGN